MCSVESRATMWLYASACWSILVDSTISIREFVCHAFSAVGLGGFSTHDASVGFFNSAAIECVLSALMLIASLNFARHFVALRRLSLEPYSRDPEFRAVIAVLGVSILVIARTCS